jgi:hypothetical protein
VPAVGAEREVGADLDGTGFCIRPHADDAAALLYEIGRFRLHHEAEAMVASAVLRHEIEEIPLRHENQELAGGRQSREIRHRDAGATDLPPKRPDLVMWQAQERVQQSKFVHQFESRGMYGVATEVAQEIRLFLQHNHIDALACQQELLHHAGRSAADDATLCGKCAHKRATRSELRRLPALGHWQTGGFRFAKWGGG